MSNKNKVMSFLILVVLISLNIACDRLACDKSACDRSVKEEYELRERCGKSAVEYIKNVKENPMSGYELSGSYSNHYNKKLNKCFIHYTYTLLPGKSSLGVRQPYYYEYLYDLNENKNYGGFSEPLNNTEFNGQIERKDCCKTKEEWDKLIKPYMEE